MTRNWMKCGRLAVAGITVVAAMTLSGCGVSGSTAGVSVTATLGRIAGGVHGGQQPVAGAAVYLYAAGEGGYGTASTSLLSSAPGQTLEDINGHYYTLTDEKGLFDLSGAYTCVPGTQVYVVALGGNPGAGVNSAAGLMAVLGQCPEGGSLAASVPYVSVNEVSTVAAAYALAAFATDATHVASAGTSASKVGMANAFAGAANLFDIGGGGSPSGALAKTPAGNGTVPQAELNSLANILAACVNSNGPGSSACGVVLDNAKSAGATGTRAPETATAAINLAHFPGTAVAALFATAGGVGAPFQPSLSAAPNDFTVAIDFVGAGMDGPEALAIDAENNVWLANAVSISGVTGTGVPITDATGLTAGTQGSPGGLAVDVDGNLWVTDTDDSAVSEISTSGELMSGGNGYPMSAQTGPYGIAIDGTGDAWVADSGSSALSELSSTGTLKIAGSYAGGLSYPVAVAIDAEGKSWTADAGGDCLTVITQLGVALSGDDGYEGGGLNWPTAVAIDAGGHAWSANLFGSSVSEFSNAGAVMSVGGYTGGGLYFPTSIAVDGVGHVWVANNNTGVTELANDGSLLSGQNGYLEGALAEENSLGVDGSGNVWVTNGTGVTEFIGAGAPVVTPLAVAVKTNTLGQRP
jgi:streptogramin lyase